jgi:aldehyde dehydrogenase (NAD+)
MWGKLLNAGQTCVAPDFVCIHQSKKQEFLQACIESIENFYTENPQKSESFGRIVSPHRFEHLKNLLAQSQTFYGGECDEPTRYIAPTLVADVDWQHPLMQEEIFGPILPVLTYEKESTLCQQLQSMPTPLALYVYSEKKQKQEFWLKNISSGGACVNDCILHLANADLPFGGKGASGMGAYHGQASFELFSHKRSVFSASTFIDNPLRYPPYSDKKLQLTKKFV